MKKFFIAALALVGMSTSAMAFDNEPEEGISTQVIAGITTSNITGNIIDPQTLKGVDFGSKVGGTLGVKFEYMLPNAHGTYVNAGLDWKMKGASADVTTDAGNQGLVNATRRVTTHYIELPIHAGFRYNITESIGVYGEVGPYFSLGLIGRNSLLIDADGSWCESYEDEGSYRVFKSAKDLLTFERWDAGFGFRIGAEYDNRYSINLSCDWGITDIYRDNTRDFIFDSFEQQGKKFSLDKAHNFCLDITLGYRF